MGLTKLNADQAIAVHAVTAVRYCKARCYALLNRTVTDANSTTAAREALTATGFAVPDMTVPGVGTVRAVLRGARRVGRAYLAGYSRAGRPAAPNSRR